MTVMFVLRGVHEFTTKSTGCQAWAACLLWRAELGTPPGSTVKDSQESKLRCRDFKTFRDFNGFHVSWMLHNWLLACCWVWPRFRLERCKSSCMLASKHRWCQQVPASQSRRSLTVGYSHDFPGHSQHLSPKHELTSECPDQHSFEAKVKTI